MKVVAPSYKILTPISDGGIEELKKIELIGRTCYRSEDKISEDGETAKRFVSNLIKNGHEAMIEHSQLTVQFIVDRGVTHELVRHRLASYAQESTRYVKYSLDKNGGEVTVVIPTMFLDEDGDSMFISDKKYTIDEIDEILNDIDFGINNGPLENNTAQKFIWYKSCLQSEKSYMDMIDKGASAQLARSVLPTSTKALITVSANYREWRAIFKLRADKPHAHPDIYWIMSKLLKDLKQKLPVVFDDIYPEII